MQSSKIAASRISNSTQNTIVGIQEKVAKLSRARRNLDSLIAKKKKKEGTMLYEDYYPIFVG